MFSKTCFGFRRLLWHPKIVQRKKSTSSVNKYVSYFFNRHLALTNSLSSGGFMALGDLIHQVFEHGTTKDNCYKYDWMRLVRMFIVGTALGAGHHYYYLQLDKLLPRADVANTIKKILADQLIVCPITIYCFFIGLGALEKRSNSEMTTEFLNKFPYIYIVDCCYWPPIQFINFYYLPTQYRMIYINIATMVFNVFLSYMKYKFQEKS